MGRQADYAIGIQLGGALEVRRFAAHHARVIERTAAAQLTRRPEFEQTIRSATASIPFDRGEFNVTNTISGRGIDGIFYMAYSAGSPGQCQCQFNASVLTAP